MSVNNSKTHTGKCLILKVFNTQLTQKAFGASSEKNLRCVSKTADIEAALTLSWETKSRQETEDKQATTLSLERASGQGVRWRLSLTGQQQP